MMTERIITRKSRVTCSDGRFYRRGRLSCECLLQEV